MALPPFQILLDRHAREIHRFLVASVGRAEADDCYQETWVAALRSYPRVSNDSNLRAWLFTIAQRKTLDHWRRQRREPVPVAEVPEVAVDGGISELATSPWPAVGALPEKQKMAVALRYALDADYGDVAAAMGISEAAARRNVHEGLKKLRLALAESEEVSR